MNKEYNIKNLLEEYIIAIPEMQRDYVWSVTSDNVYKLLQTISEANKAKVNIGFVYACKQDNHFCLIDGQQRLTTLILIMFYLALRDNGKNWGAFQQIIAPNKTLRFTYRVRESAENFMKKLFLDESCPSFDKIRTLSADEWGNDTTVENMIETLHIIDRYIQMSIFCQNDETVNFKDIIQNVKFYYTDIEQTMQGRDIYITMNSCGRPLAKYERLKPYIVKNDLDKSEKWNMWEDWLYHKTKKYHLEKGTVDIAMGNFLRIVYELKTSKPITDNWEIMAESTLSYDDVNSCFDALIRLEDSHPEIVRELFNPAKTKEKVLFFRGPKAMLQAILQELYLKQSTLSCELKRMFHLVQMCLRGKTMKDEDLLLFLRRYRESRLDLYTFVDNSAEDSVVTSCLHQHEIRKIQFIQHGTKKTERLFLEAEQLDLYDTKEYYCLLNALWDEKFSEDSLVWTEQDDAEFKKRINTFAFLFKNKWMELKHEHEDGVIDNAFLTRYLLSLQKYDYYLQEREYRILGRDKTWSSLLANEISCNRISCMIGKLCNITHENMYSEMLMQINTAWKTYTGSHDARYYILKYPNSLKAKSKGWNKLWIESIWDNRISWKSFNIAIYSAPQNWNEDNGAWMFESLLVDKSKKYCVGNWPILTNGIYLKNGRNRHGWRVLYDKGFTHKEIVEYLKKLVSKNPNIMKIPLTEEEDNFVFVDIVNDFDLIDGGVILLDYLNKLSK